MDYSLNTHHSNYTYANTVCTSIKDYDAIQKCRKAAEDERQSKRQWVSLSPVDTRFENIDLTEEDLPPQKIDLAKESPPPLHQIKLYRQWTETENQSLEEMFPTATMDNVPKKADIIEEMKKKNIQLPNCTWKDIQDCYRNILKRKK